MLWKSLEGELFTYKYYLKKLLGVRGFGAVFSADEVIGDLVIREVAVTANSNQMKPRLKS